MGALFGILMGFFVDIFSKLFLHAAFKIAITLAFIVMVVAAIYAYVAAYSTIVNGIAQSVPTIVSGVWGWVMPANLNSCLIAIFSCVILRFVTKMYLKVMDYKIKAALSN